MLDIERYVGQKIRRQKLDGFNYVYTALFEEGKGKGSVKPVKGFRTSKGYSFGRYGR
jgi:ATP-dependent RNA helicase RhlE